MLIESICFLVIFYVAAKLYYDKHTRYWDHFENVPLRKFTLLGHVPDFMFISDSMFTVKLHEWFEGSISDSVMVWIGMRPILFTRDQKLFQNVLTSSKHISKSLNYWVMEDFIGIRSLFLSTGSLWRKKRKVLTPSFHFSILTNFLTIMKNHSKNLCEYLDTYVETGNTFDAFKIMKLYSIGIISQTAMGVECNVVKSTMKKHSELTQDEKDSIEFVHAMDRTLENMLDRDTNVFYWYKPLFMLFPVGRQYYKDLRTLKNYAMKVIDQRIKHRKESLEIDHNNSSENSNTDEASLNNPMIFLDNILTHYQKGIFTIEDVLSETQTFMLGGYDTVATALSWALFMLGRYPEKQEKAYQEVRRVDALKVPIKEAVKQLDYTECVIKETLRIHPSAPMISRQIEEDTTIDSVFYPKGSIIALSLLEIQRYSKHWDNPMQFEPERFLHIKDGVNTKESSHFSFVPFSAGPRNCIGQKFAMMEIKTTLFHLLRQFEIIALQEEKELIEVSGIMHYVENKEGLQIQLKHRDTN